MKALVQFSLGLEPYLQTEIFRLSEVSVSFACEYRRHYRRHYRRYKRGVGLITEVMYVGGRKKHSECRSER